MIERIEIIPSLKDNFIFALINGRQCAVIDPGEAAPVKKFLENEKLSLTHILCTHHHWDHVSGIPDLPADEVWCSPFDRSRIPRATKSVSSHEQLWDEEVLILNVPGHTLGQVAYYFPRLKAVFPGDTLFSAGCGRLFEGTPAQMFSSMKILRSLPPDTALYFGHEYTLHNLDFVEKYQAADTRSVESYRQQCLKKLANKQPTVPSSIAAELEVNPFLKAATEDEFTKWRELRNQW